MEIFLERLVIEVLVPMLYQLSKIAGKDPAVYSKLDQIVLELDKAETTEQRRAANRKIHDL